MAERLCALKKIGGGNGGNSMIPMYIATKGGNGGGKLILFDGTTSSIYYSRGSNYNGDDISFTGGGSSITFKKAGYYNRNGTWETCTANSTGSISGNTDVIIAYEGLVNPFA